MAFTCKPVGYQVAVQAPNIDSGLFEINLVTGNVTIINPDIGLVTVAIGYNVIDDLIYGVSDQNNQLISIDELGVVTNIGPVVGVQPSSYNVADIDSSGNFYLYETNDVNFYVIDVDPFSGTFGDLLATIPIAATNIADWSFNPNDGMLYAIDNATVSLVQINPVTGIVTPLPTVGMPPAGSPWGASFFDANDFFYVIENDTGRIYRLFNAGLNASALLFSQSIISDMNDGASCVLQAIEIDFGDAPDTGIGTGSGNYNTLLASDGPRHQIINSLFLGTQATAESDAFQNTTATGDDIGAGIPDDGVTLPLMPILTTDVTYAINLQVTNDTGSNANLYIWIDFDSNGVFQEEEAATPIVIPSAVGLQNVVANFNLPFLPTSGTSFVRARLTTDILTNTNPANLEDTRSIGAASDGEVEDYLIEIIGVDFGDAPDIALGTGIGNYNTLLASNGPSHQMINELFLGTQATGELDAYENPIATGDDIGAGIPDDGVTLPLTPILTTDVVYAINMSVTNNTGSDANLYVWVDLNRDGIFAGEEAAAPIVVPSAVGVQNVVANFILPFMPISGLSFVRARLTTDNLINTNVDPTLEDTRSLGSASDGEVEDYAIGIFGIDYGDAPDIAPGTGTGNYNTLFGSNGPRHQLGSALFLGTVVTGELNAYQTPTAIGDDIPLGIPDDAVILPLPPVADPCTTTYTIENMVVTNQTGEDANLYAWIDFNRDGVFQGRESAQPIIVPNDLFPQSVNVIFDLPVGTLVSGNSFVRVRLTTDTLINTNLDLDLEDTRSLGLATDGEVEDYAIEIVVLTELIVPIKTVDVNVADIGDIVNYTIAIPNNTSYDITNLVFIDPLPDGLSLVFGSFSVNGVTVDDPNLVLGVPIGDLPSGEVTIVSFSAKVTDDANLCGTTLSNQAFINLCDDVTIPTNIIDIVVECVSIEVVKEADKSFIIVGDVVTYTITITNTGFVPLDHIILIDEIADCASFVTNSVKINEITKPGLNPELGIIIGTLNASESVSVKFSVILEEICIPPRLSNRATVTYEYTINDITKIASQESNLVVINTGPTSFKQLSRDGTLEISCQKPDIESILSAIVTIEIENTIVIKTPVLTSVSGQRLSGNKLIIEGVLNEKIEYVALLPDQPVNSAHFRVRFSTFIILPEDYAGETIDVESLIEDVFTQLIDERTIFINVTFMLLVVQGI